MVGAESRVRQRGSHGLRLRERAISGARRSASLVYRGTTLASLAGYGSAELKLEKLATNQRPPRRRTNCVSARVPAYVHVLRPDLRATGAPGAHMPTSVRSHTALTRDGPERTREHAPHTNAISTTAQVAKARAQLSDESAEAHGNASAPCPIPVSSDARKARQNPTGRTKYVEFGSITYICSGAELKLRQVVAGSTTRIRRRATAGRIHACSLTGCAGRHDP